MITNEVAKYLGRKIGDKVTMYVDFGKTFGNVKSPNAHLFSMLTAGIDNVTVDFDQELIQFNDIGIPFEMLGLNAEKYEVTYTIKGTYDEANGKFSEGYGNVALIDCHYVVDDFIDLQYKELDHIRGQISYFEYLELYGLLRYVQQ